MTEWLNERYISRDEHQKIVAYYKKLVSQLYSTIRDLRKPEEGNAPLQHQVMSDSRFTATATVSDDTAAIIHTDTAVIRTDNVIVVDFRSRSAAT